METFKNRFSPNHDTIHRIFEEYHSVLIKYGLNICNDKELVEDSIQDLFVKFCTDEALIINADNQRAYLLSSLRRMVIKKARKRNIDGLSEQNLREISVPSYEEKLISSQTNMQNAVRMREALSVLSKSQKTIITLRFYRSMSYDDIAEKLGVTKRTVYNQIHDSIKKIRVFYMDS